MLSVTQRNKQTYGPDGAMVVPLIYIYCHRQGRDAGEDHPGRDDRADHHHPHGQRGEEAAAHLLPQGAAPGQAAGGDIV